MPMSDTETDTEYTSKAFPTAGDLARWNALSPAEQVISLKAANKRVLITALHVQSAWRRALFA